MFHVDISSNRFNCSVLNSTRKYRSSACVLKACELDLPKFIPHSQNSKNKTLVRFFIENNLQKESILCILLQNNMVFYGSVWNQFSIWCQIFKQYLMLFNIKTSYPFDIDPDIKEILTIIDGLPNEFNKHNYFSFWIRYSYFMWII